MAELEQAHSFLAPLLGSAIAPTLFAIALLCCGLNSTVTATLAGQIVMEGFLDIRLPAWARRLVTRAIAIVPAAIVTIWYGEKGTAQLLILSQVVLSLQLPFAIVPLVMFTADRRKMGELVAPRWVTALAALTVAVVIIVAQREADLRLRDGLASAELFWIALRLAPLIPAQAGIQVVWHWVPAFAGTSGRTHSVRNNPLQLAKHELSASFAARQHIVDVHRSKIVGEHRRLRLRRISVRRAASFVIAKRNL